MLPTVKPTRSSRLSVVTHALARSGIRINKASATHEMTKHESASRAIARLTLRGNPTTHDEALAANWLINRSLTDTVIFPLLRDTKPALHPPDKQVYSPHSYAHLTGMSRRPTDMHHKHAFFAGQPAAKHAQTQKCSPQQAPNITKSGGHKLGSVNLSGHTSPDLSGRFAWRRKSSTALTYRTVYSIWGVFRNSGAEKQRKRYIETHTHAHTQTQTQRQIDSLKESEYAGAMYDFKPRR